MIIAFGLTLLAVHQAPTYDEAWKLEQAARGKANEMIQAQPGKREEILKGIKALEEVLAYTRKAEIETIKDSQGRQPFVLQRNDIYADEVIGYALLKDSSGVIQALQALRKNFTEGNALTRSASLQAGFYYSDTIGRDLSLQKLMPEPNISNGLRAIRVLDPNLRFHSYPYDITERGTLDEADRVAGLSELWSEAKFNFANFDLVPGLDWNEAYENFLPRVRKAKNNYDYYNVLREFLALLGDGHTDISLPPKLKRQKEAGVGLITGLIEGKVVVLSAVAEVAKLGVVPGDVVEMIDGVPATTYGKERWAKRVSSSTPQDRDVRVYRYMLWAGPQGSSVRVRLRSATGAIKDVTLSRPAQRLFPALPPYEFKLLADGTAYFAFNTCVSNVPAEAFEMNLDAIRKAGRLVIDVRSNGGGDSGVGYEILSHLIAQPVASSTWETPQYRAAYRAWGRPQTPFRGESETIEPSKKRFDGPVVVLTGPRTFSAAEDFASACKTSHRVIMVGEATGGSTGQPLPILLPGGGHGRICTKRDRYPDGSDFVGKGVQPDVLISPTIKSIQLGEDLQLEKAIEALSKKK